MGREIFYCYLCAARVTSADLARGAVRWNHRVACAACAPALDASPEALAPRPTTALRVPAPVPPRRPRRLARAAGVVTLILAMGLFGLMSSRSPAPVTTEEPTAGSAPSPPPPPPPDREVLAFAALEEARARGMRDPSDAKGLVRRLNETAARWTGTSASDAARRQAEALSRELRQRREGILAALDADLSEADPARARELLAQRETLYDDPAWAEEIRRRRAGVAAPAPPPARPGPPGPSPREAEERAAWARAWREAATRAAARDFDAALRTLRAAAEALTVEAVRNEANEDVARFVSARDGLSRALGRLSALARGRDVSLRVWDEDGKRARLEGRVWRAWSDGLEVKRPGVEAPLWVDFVDVAAATLAVQDGVSPDAGRLLRLLEGDASAADGRAYAAAWAARPAIAPRERQSIDARNERHARRLLREADRAFAFRAARPSAVLLYRRLLSDYGDTSAVLRERAVVESRLQACRDHVFGPDDLVATGTFERSSWSSRRHGVPACWTSSSDIDWRESLNNYVELVFPALPDTAYRCWVYAGGCCLETFTFHYQSSELVREHRDTKGPISLEPGGSHAFPVEPDGYFRARHVHHAARKGPKQPERWQWIEIPLARYAEPGLKRVRVLTSEKGFSVAYAVVSADRTSPPEEGAAARSRRHEEKEGAKEPGEWLVLAPFPNRGFGTREDVEFDLGLEERHRTADGLRGWSHELAELVPAGGAKAARLDFAVSFRPSENVVAYALQHVWSPSARDARLRVGSDDGIQIWHEGRRIHGLNRSRGVKVDEDTVKLALKEGWNRLLFKVYQGKGGWGLAARVTDPAGKPIKDLRYSPWGDDPAGPAAAMPDGLTASTPEE